MKKLNKREFQKALCLKTYFRHISKIFKILEKVKNEF